jgi:hypothetical protein
MKEPSPDFKLRSGKFQGMTYEWVCDNHPSYISWVKDNQPNMLLEKVTTVIDVKETKQEFGKLTPNMNFENEGPELYCLSYLNKMKELNQK